MMKYFENVKTLDELKKQYRRLARTSTTRPPKPPLKWA